MELGDLRQAAMYANMLKGVSQHLASGWTEEVLLHLQVAQAASTLSAFAALVVDHYHKDINQLKSNN